ncbi:MAG TPA: rhomboid family intramembrane serine protease [Candidatus Limnocylindrales bacterium]|nr:rhomboid family intramembrane serine protease [Candidatus Limnocylindrales bacterium]
MAGIIPISDASRHSRTLPILTILIIVVNIAVFLLELQQGEAFVIQWSVVPAQITAGHHWINILTAMFMHAGWMHIISNMVFLWCFGPMIEDAMGPARYLPFYILSGITGSLAQIALVPSSTLPELGASGAIAGIMGAFLVTYPGDRIKSVMFLGIFWKTTFIPAAILIGVWFLIQLFSQVTAGPSQSGEGVAYAAHVGGFIFGAIFGRLLERPQCSEAWS